MNSDAAVEWFSTVPRRPLKAGVLFTDLHRLREMARAEGLKTHQMETRFLRFRSSLIDALVSFHMSSCEIEQLIGSSGFEDLTTIVHTWDEAIGTLELAFDRGNNVWDSSGVDIWKSQDVIAVNLWRDFEH